MKCEICYVWGATYFTMGGLHPSYTYRKPVCKLCKECQDTLLKLFNEGSIKLRTGKRDTTNSRFSLFKAAVKRERFGHANIKLKARQ
jgi:hypothetical protein